VRRSFILVAAAAISAVLVAGALAAKPPNGSTTGIGTVFLPNPVATLQDQSLTDQKDADYAALAPAYRDVTLTNLDGSGRLCGDWACVISETGDPAYSSTSTFRYRRDDDRFEQVMAYYWVTQAQLYLQSLGFGRDLRPVNAEQQDIRINTWGQDNSYSWDKHDVLRFGKGGVDDAEDGEVIVHEYGHSVQDDQVPGFGSSPDAGAIGEGFSDYFAVTVGLAVTGETFQAPCVADWDSVSYTPGPIHCLRRLDSTKHYPEDLHPRREVHADGELWSAALWRARNLVGNTRLVDTIIIDAQFGFAPGTSFQDAARKTIDTAEQYGVGAAFTQAFTERGFFG
jgi:hypothetical protein